MYIVVYDSLADVGIYKIRFKGNKEECLEYMKKHNDVDLMRNGKFVSWVIKEEDFQCPECCKPDYACDC